ncbi:MAG: hypothetical protein KDC70_16960, partial [Saprospiraceae bacterium]|nr:hypothetical protein [Saprospiraceae bacterium]
MKRGDKWFGGFWQFGVDEPTKFAIYLNNDTFGTKAATKNIHAGNRLLWQPRMLPVHLPTNLFFRSTAISKMNSCYALALVMACARIAFGQTTDPAACFQSGPVFFSANFDSLNIYG